ncbi:Sec-independent protein translocase protein TatB [Faucicola mancuniensis]|uniref:Sec-independent protein translocase protein TatB n=1 Tax=Faucicola mancuniensis TaxID=1309795 RepID=UPI0028EFDD9A|nr:Sec-independent protein translocase protein TatB [uncultured Moraxella sp.]
MFDIGFSELLLFGIIALVVLGPEKLPHAVRTAGRYYAKFRRTVATLQSEIEAELDLAETRKQMQEELAKIRQAEADMKKEMDALRTSFHELQENQQHSLNQTLNAQHTNTAPMLNTWFLLGDYDKKRRLPNAPFLPNYQADKLMFNHQTAPNTTGADHV